MYNLEEEVCVGACKSEQWEGLREDKEVLELCKPLSQENQEREGWC